MIITRIAYAGRNPADKALCAGVMILGWWIGVRTVLAHRMYFKNLGFVYFQIGPIQIWKPS